MASGEMPEFVHQRHKSPSGLDVPRELVLAVPQLRSAVNLSRMIRAAGCCGVKRVIACGRGKVDAKIARDALEFLVVERHRSLPPVLKALKHEGYQIVGLEQTSGSQCLYDFKFARRSVLVVGHERLGLQPDELAVLDVAVEIPVFGLPLSYNVATATAMALYEYCRQYPHG